MNYIAKYFLHVLCIVLMAFCIYQYFRNESLNKKIESLNLQNLDGDSQRKQVKIDYIERDKKMLVDSIKALAALRIRDTLQLKKLQSENDRLKKGLHEKYITIDRMDGHELFDFFARLDTGSVEGK